MLFSSLLRCAILSVALAATIPFANATGHKSNEDLADLAQMELIQGWMRDDGLYMAAIRVRLAPGWKTYWREPGGNGIAPQFDWSGSSNLAQVGYFWPTPQVFDDYGTRTIGYERELILPILLKPTNGSQPIGARVTMDYGVCKDICVPVRSTHQNAFDDGPATNRALIEQAVSLRPRSGRAAGMQTATCSISQNGSDYVLHASLTFSSNVRELRAVVVESGLPDIWISTADHRQNGSLLTIEADLKNYGNGPMAVQRDALRFTLIGEEHSIDVRGCTAG